MFMTTFMYDQYRHRVEQLLTEDVRVHIAQPALKSEKQ
jgi:YD repeat-containing protein